MSTEDAAMPEPVRLEGPPPRLLIVRAPYYAQVVAGLSAGAERLLKASGATADALDVAGAFELPQAIRIALRPSSWHDGFIALGCIVRGETDHYEYISRAVMGGLMEVALRFGIPLGTGVLTVDSLEQARARSGMSGPNKGAEAARAALLQIAAQRRFSGAWAEK